MSSSENDIETTPVDPEETTGTAGTGNPAGLDEVGSPSPDGPDGVDAAGEEQIPPLPDWGPTDGVHGTDAETADGTDASGTAGH